MKLTNKFGLPEPIVKAAAALDRKPGKAGYTVTELIKPPHLYQLEKEHYEQIEEDVSDRVWAIFGTAVHGMLEKHEVSDSITEEKLKAKIGDTEVSGTPDYYKDEVVHDYKVCSAYKVVMGDNADWSEQLNCYRYLYEQNGLPVKGLEIVAILRDWSKLKARTEDDYPKAPIVRIKIDMWPAGAAEKFMAERIKMLETKQVECSPEDRWAKPTTYAIIKPGRKSAVRVFGTEDEANRYLEDYQGAEVLRVETRKGSDNRCVDYCRVKTWCPYYLETYGKGETNEN